MRNSDKEIKEICIKNTKYVLKQTLDELTETYGVLLCEHKEFYDIAISILEQKERD